MPLPPRHDCISKTEMWVSFSEVPCGAVLLDHNRPQIWQQQPLLAENTEERLPIKAQEDFGWSRNAIKMYKKAKFDFNTKDLRMSLNQTRDIKEQIDHNLLYLWIKRGGHILPSGFGYHIT